MKNKAITLTALFLLGAAYAAEQGRTQLKSYFQTGDKPTEAEFGHLIDSAYNITDDTIAGFSTFAELDILVADKSLANLQDAKTWTGVQTFGGFNAGGTTTFTTSPTFNIGAAVASGQVLTVDNIAESTGAAGTTFDDTTTFADVATFSAGAQFDTTLDVDGSTQLGNANTDIHGINTAPVAGQMMTEVFGDSSAVSSVGRSSNIVHTGSAASGTILKYGNWNTHTISGTYSGSASQTTHTVRSLLTDTCTYNTTGSVFQAGGWASASSILVAASSRVTNRNARGYHMTLKDSTKLQTLPKPSTRLYQRGIDQLTRIREAVWSAQAIPRQILKGSGSSCVGQRGLIRHTRTLPVTVNCGGTPPIQRLVGK